MLPIYTGDRRKKITFCLLILFTCAVTPSTHTQPHTNTVKRFAHLYTAMLCGRYMQGWRESEGTIGNQERERDRQKEERRAKKRSTEFRLTAFVSVFNLFAVHRIIKETYNSNSLGFTIHFVHHFFAHTHTSTQA